MGKLINDIDFLKSLGYTLPDDLENKLEDVNRICSVCYETKKLSAFIPHAQCTFGYTRVCTDCGNKKSIENRRQNPIAYKSNKLVYRYGITNEQFEALLELQKYRCAICEIHQNELPNKQKILYIDHDHKTGKVRGLLCPKCNSFIGYLDKDNHLDKALQYLKDANAI
jgi:hypothetical protein